MARPNPRERLLRRGVRQEDVCMRHCGARCCRYLTVRIDTPTAGSDWDEIRWWLAHEGVSVSKDEDGWLLAVETRCGNLRGDGGCGIYGARMDVCSEHAVEDCEFALPLANEVELRSETDLARYLERRRLKRGRRVAESIRKAEALRTRAAAARTTSPSAGALVQVQPLPEAR